MRKYMFCEKCHAKIYFPTIPWRGKYYCPCCHHKNLVNSSPSHGIKYPLLSTIVHWIVRVGLISLVSFISLKEHLVEDNLPWSIPIAMIILIMVAFICNVIFVWLFFPAD